MRTLIVLGFVIMASACGADSTSPVVTGPVGTFSLGTVDGATLPATLGSTQAGGPWYLRGSISLKSDGTFAQALTDSLGVAGSKAGVTSESGTWTVASGDSLVLTTSGLTSTAGRVSNDSIWRREYGRLFAFKRQ